MKNNPRRGEKRSANPGSAAMAALPRSARFGIPGLVEVEVDDKGFSASTPVGSVRADADGVTVGSKVGGVTVGKDGVRIDSPVGGVEIRNDGVSVATPTGGVSIGSDGSVSVTPPGGTPRLGAGGAGEIGIPFPSFKLTAMEIPIPVPRFTIQPLDIPLPVPRFSTERLQLPLTVPAFGVPEAVPGWPFGTSSSFPDVVMTPPGLPAPLPWFEAPAPWVPQVCRAVAPTVAIWKYGTHAQGGAVNSGVGILPPGTLRSDIDFGATLEARLTAERVPAGLANAAAKTLAAAWDGWFDKFTGSLQYPLFMAYPGPFAGPMPNLAVPLVAAGVSTGWAAVTPLALEQAFLAMPDILGDAALRVTGPGALPSGRKWAWVPARI